ncbi:MAG: MurR/RpiR family transcriptional regulator [Cloacibacillus sp.]
MKTISEKIIEAAPNLTKKQTFIGKFICDNIYEVALLNAPQIAKKAHVSEATLTRFVYAIGYSSFSAFQLDLRIQTQEATQTSAFRQISCVGSDEHVVHRILTLEKDLIDETMLSIDPQIFDQCVDRLIQADTVVLVGGPTQGYLVQYLADYLTIFRERVFVVKQRDMAFYGAMEFLCEKSVALVFTYPRYPKETLKIASTLHTQGIPIIAVTDSQMSPIVQHANHVLITPLKYFLFVEPASSAVALIHAMLMRMYQKDNANIKERLKRYEALIIASDMFEFKEYDFTVKLP